MRRKDEVISNINKEISKPIGIFGARGSGKTIYLSMLFGTGGDNELSVNLKYDDKNNEKYYDTKEYLKSNYNKLLNQNLPDATIDGNDFSIKIEFNYKKRNEKLYTYEYAGELVETAEKMDSTQRKHHHNLLDFFSNCSGIIVFLEPSEEKNRILNLDMNIEKLLSFLKSKNIDIPIGIAITKWDKVKSKISYDIELEKNELLKFINERSLYKNIYNRISNSMSTYEVFPISSYGHHEESGLPPKELKPFNLYEPIKWLADNKEYKIKELIKKEITTDLNLNNKKELVNMFLKRYINSKYENELIEVIKNEKKKNKNKNILLVISLVIVVLGLVFFVVIQEKVKIKSEFCEILLNEDKLKKNENLKKFEKKYGENISFKEILENEKNNLENEINEMMKNEYKKILDENNLNVKRELIISFIEKYGKNNQYANELSSIKTKVEYLLSFDREYLKLNEKILDNSIMYYEKYVEMKIFLKKYENETGTIILDKYSDIKIRINEILEKADDEKYENVKSFIFNYQGRFDKIKEEIHEYLNINAFVQHREEMLRILDEEEKKEEIKYLTAIKDAIRKYNEDKTYINCKYISSCCENYLSIEVPKNYKYQVEKILERVKDLIQNKQTISLQLKLNGDFGLWSKKMNIIITNGDKTETMKGNIRKENNFGRYEPQINFDSILKFEFMYKEKQNIGIVEIKGEELLKPRFKKVFINTSNQKEACLTIENLSLHTYNIKNTINYVK